jgi:branched-chain amino acid aminotransferase/4-amino-4-deoxychorismate lyase
VRRNQGSPASRLKTLSYLDNVLARREAAPAEALMLNTAGQVACAAIGNLYWVEGEVVHTPALDCGVLAGVMRAEILRRAPGLGIRILEVRAPAAALAATPAMAMSNSLAGLRRIASLDGRALRGHPLLDRLAADLADVSWSW